LGAVSHLSKNRAVRANHLYFAIIITKRTKDIELQFVNTAKIDYLAVTQKLDDGKAIINAKADVTSFGNYDSEIKVICQSGTPFNTN